MSNIYKSAEVLIDKSKYVMSENEVSSSPEKSASNEKIKSESGGAFSVDEEVQKNMIIHHARMTAEEIIEDAKERSGEMYREGFTKGLDEGERQYIGYLEQARQVLEQAHDEKENIIKDYEDEILSLSIDIAEKIVGRRIAEDKAFLHDIFINAVNRTIHETDGRVKVRMSVESINSLMSDDELRHMKAEFHPDKSLMESECIIETENGTADAGLESQFNQVRKSFGVLSK